MADTINTTETTHETKKPNAFVNFFKNSLADKRYDSLGLIGAGVLCCVLSGAMGIVGIIFVAIGIFLSYKYGGINKSFRETKQPIPPIKQDFKKGIDTFLHVCFKFFYFLKLPLLNLLLYN